MLEADLIPHIVLARDAQLRELLLDMLYWLRRGRWEPALPLTPVQRIMRDEEVSKSLAYYRLNKRTGVAS